MISIILKTLSVDEQKKQQNTHSEFKNPLGVPSNSPICQMILLGTLSALAMLPDTVVAATTVILFVATANSPLYNV